MFRSFMDVALAEARAAADRGEVPVGAAVTRGAAVLARAGNRMRELRDPTAHAEILALREAAAGQGGRLGGCTLWVTLEPCPMCAGAVAQSRVARLVYAAPDPKSGGVAQGPRVLSHPQAHGAVEVVEGPGAEAAAALLRAFFAARR